MCVGQEGSGCILRSLLVDEILLLIVDILRNKYVLDILNRKIVIVIVFFFFYPCTPEKQHVII